MLDLFTSRERIAYFSMEVAVHSDVPTYSGGLGILAALALLGHAASGGALKGPRGRGYPQHTASADRAP